MRSRSQQAESAELAAHRVGTLVSVNVGMPKEVLWQGKTVFTGVFKEPVTGPRRVRKLNVDSDGQADLAGHGGEQRAVFVYQIESYRYWERELGRNDFVNGQFGENFTIEDRATTRSASATATGSAPPYSKSHNRGSPATASGSA